MFSVQIQELFKMEPVAMAEWLSTFYGEPIPDSIETLEDMERAGRLLPALTNSWSYLTEISAYSKILVRQAKRKVDKSNPKTKEEYEDMVDRQYIIQLAVDILKQKYNTVSRMITTKQEINSELKMTQM